MELMAKAKAALVLADPGGSTGPNGSGGGGTGGFHTDSLIAWIENSALPLIVLGVAAFLMLRSPDRNIGKSITVLACLLVGLLVAGLATSGNLLGLGSWLASQVA
jgi:hypothetical protein